MSNSHRDESPTGGVGNKALAGILRTGGRLIVISGPSGVGKGTVISRLLGSSRRPENLLRCITATTRPPREGEVDGRSYYFFSRAQFEERIGKGFFIEHVTYNNHLYGTPCEDVERELAKGNDVLIEIEVRGGLTIKASRPEAILVFVAPPSWADLEKRLKGRATDTSAQVANRLQIAREEMKAAPNYDYLVVNDQVDGAVDTLLAVITAERSRILKEST